MKKLLGELELNRIYQQNAIEGLKLIPENSIDLIFTDPPYKLIGGGRKNTLLKESGEHTAFTNSGEVFKTKTPKFKEWIPLLYRILKDERYIFIMSNDRNMREIWDECEKTGFTFCELLVMNKKQGVPSSYFFKSCEFILMFRKGKYRKFEKFGHKTVFEVDMPRGKNKIHPTQKPVQGLIVPILEACTKENEVVLDPFMGSASTAVASSLLKRNWIGFELDSTYIELANKRLDQIELHNDLNELI